MRRLLALHVALVVVVLGFVDTAQAQKKKIDVLLKDIDSKDANTRITALKDVGDLAEVKISYAQMALPQIRTILEKEPDVKVRIAALGALGKIESEPKEYVPNMLKYLKEDKDFGVQGTALGLLGGYQQQAAAAITPLKERMEELRDTNKDQDPGGIRSGILNTLSQINQGLGLPTSLEALKEDKAVSVKLTAVGRIIGIAQQGGAKENGPELIEAYQESLKAGPNPELRRNILVALASIEPDAKKYLPMLVDTLKKDKDAGITAAVIAALGRGGEAPKETHPLIIDAAKNATANAPKDGGDPGEMRRNIMSSIAKVGIEPKEVTQVLIDSLKKEKELNVRAAVLVSLGQLGDKGKDAIATVVASQKAGAPAGLKDENDPADLRKISLDTLMKLGTDPKELVPILTSSTKDRNYPVRLLAVNLLGEIGAPAKPALTTLTGLQKLPKSPTEQDKALAAAAGEAIEKIKGK